MSAPTPGNCSSEQHRERALTIHSFSIAPRTGISSRAVIDLRIGAPAQERELLPLAPLTSGVSAHEHRSRHRRRPLTGGDRRRNERRPDRAATSAPHAGKEDIDLEDAGVAGSAEMSSRLDDGSMVDGLTFPRARPILSLVEQQHR